MKEEGGANLSLYSVLVANKPLQPIDCTGIKEFTVKELKALHPEKVEEPWYSMPDSTRLIYAPDESAFRKLQIFHWETPHYDLDDYNNKPYVYGIEGNWQGDFLTDLHQYIQQHIGRGSEAQLIRFWAGEPFKPLKRQDWLIADVTIEDLAALSELERVRVYLR